MTRWVCPECAQGTHGNCNGQAWDNDADEPTQCQCSHTIAGLIDEMGVTEKGFVPIKQSSPYPYSAREEGIEALDQDDEEKITELLMGRKVTKVDGEHLLLDDGTVLKAIGHEGGCSCGAGDYDLTELNGVDNIITRVEFDYHPTGDGSYDNGKTCMHKPSEDDWEGHYRIWVYAENQKINLMEVTGSDGNGYYGTGFGLLVRRA